MKKMYPKSGRVILHVDMNSFYASVEMAYDPSLKGKPLAIAGNPDERRGIIVTCSYEARSYGVKTTMPLWEAKKLCPNLIIRKPNFDRYRAVSTAMFDLLRRYSEVVEPVSIDEGYVDITDSYKLGSPIDIAQSIQKSLVSELDLPSSIGIAPNKFLAKMASDMKKPMGITILRKRDIPQVLWPLDVEEMHGIGKRTAEKLREVNITKIADLAKANDLQLKGMLGINGIRLKERANGIDTRMVDPDAVFDFKSIGNSTTLPRDVSNQKELLQVLAMLAQKVSVRLKRKKVLATTVGITIRYKDRKTVTRSKKLNNPVSGQEELSQIATRILLKNWSGEPIRLLGITGTDLIDENQAVKQLDLFTFEKDAKKEPLFDTLSKLKEKFGDHIIEKASDVSTNIKKSDIGTDTSFNKDFLQVRKNENTKNDRK